MTPETRDRLRAERAAQGLPRYFQDAVIYERLATLMRAAPDRRPA